MAPFALCLPSGHSCATSGAVNLDYLLTHCSTSLGLLSCSINFSGRISNLRMIELVSGILSYTKINDKYVLHDIVFFLLSSKLYVCRETPIRLARLSCVILAFARNMANSLVSLWIYFSFCSFDRLSFIATPTLTHSGTPFYIKIKLRFREVCSLTKIKPEMLNAQTFRALLWPLFWRL